WSHAVGDDVPTIRSIVDSEVIPVRDARFVHHRVDLDRNDIARVDGAATLFTKCEDCLGRLFGDLTRNRRRYVDSGVGPARVISLAAIRAEDDLGEEVEEAPNILEWIGLLADRISVDVPARPGKVASDAGERRVHALDAEGTPVR